MPIDSLASEEFLEEKTSISDLIFKNRVYLSLFLVGLIFIGSGVLIFRNFKDDSKLEIVDNEAQITGSPLIFVEVAGAVENPGVYTFPATSRIEDVLIKARGFSADADRGWIEKYINRAAKLIDGQKIYIPKTGEHSDNATASNPAWEEGLLLGTSGSVTNPVNINTASIQELESLSGIGPVYAQNIIDHRPYSNIDELVSKGAIKTFVFEKIKDRVSVY